MSFEPIKFVYTPPATVEEPLPQESSYTPNTTTNNPNVDQESTATNAATSFAVALAKRYSDLADTSKYLQQIILDQTKDNTITLDFDANPELARALSIILETPNPSSVITVNAYSQMLDAQINATVTDMQLGDDSPFTVNPYQVGALSTVTQGIEQSLIAEGTFTAALPTMLNTLKGDQVIFQTTAQAMQAYPVTNYDQYQATQTASPTTTSIIPASSLDVSPSLNSYLNSYADRYSTAYAGVYNLAAGINAVDADINNVLNQYFVMPLAELKTAMALLSSLQALAHTQTLKDLSEDLINFGFMRLQCEAMMFISMFNRLINITVAPFKASLSALAQLTRSINAIANEVGTQVSGGLKGMVAGSSCSTQQNKLSILAGSKASNIKVPGISQVTKGLASLASHLNWAISQITKQEANLMKQLRRLSERRLGNQATMLEIMCSLKALNSLITFGQSIANQPTSAMASTQTQVNTVSNILSNIGSASGSGTTYSVNNGQVIVSPPSVIAPPTNVANVFATGGLTQLNLKS